MTIIQFRHQLRHFYLKTLKNCAKNLFYFIFLRNSKTLENVITYRTIHKTFNLSRATKTKRSEKTIPLVINYRTCNLLQNFCLFSYLLTDRRPAYFPALARLVEVMRRTGTLDETAPYIDKAEQAVLRPDVDSGFSFCKGLYEW